LIPVRRLRSYSDLGEPIADLTIHRPQTSTFFVTDDSNRVLGEHASYDSDTARNWHRWRSQDLIAYLSAVAGISALGAGSIRD
jgi:hypothetical protein